MSWVSPDGLGSVYAEAKVVPEPAGLGPALLTQKATVKRVEFFQSFAEGKRYDLRVRLPWL